MCTSDSPIWPFEAAGRYKFPQSKTQDPFRPVNKSFVKYVNGSRTSPFLEKAQLRAVALQILGGRYPTVWVAYLGSFAWNWQASRKRPQVPCKFLDALQ